MNDLVEITTWPGAEGGTGVFIKEKKIVNKAGHLETLLDIHRELLIAASLVKRDYDREIKERATRRLMK